MTARLELRAVSFRYPTGDAGRAAFAIRDLSFSVEPGEILGVIGPNASGKTTVIRLLSKVVTPEAGAILLDGESVAGLTLTDVARRVAVVPQDVPRGFPFTVGELVLMGRFPHGPARFFETAGDWQAAGEAMEMTGVTALCHERFERLSGGERQRVMLARALAQRPRLLVLDEPTAHLDLRHQAEAVGLLRQLNRASGLTVILVSHDLDLAGELSHRLLLMKDGAAVRTGTPDAVLEPRVLEAVYGWPVLVDTHPASGRPIVHPVWPHGATTQPASREGR